MYIVVEVDETNWAKDQVKAKALDALKMFVEAIGVVQPEDLRKIPEPGRGWAPRRDELTMKFNIDLDRVQ